MDRISFPKKGLGAIYHLRQDRHFRCSFCPNTFHEQRYFYTTYFAHTAGLSVSHFCPTIIENRSIFFWVIVWAPVWHRAQIAGPQHSNFKNGQEQSFFPSEMISSKDYQFEPRCTYFCHMPSMPSCSPRSKKDYQRHVCTKKFCSKYI